MKGIILAGGKGTRLHPITKAMNKHLLPIYDKPMIYYSISILLLVEIKEILLIINEEDYSQYEMILGNGDFIGISIEYKIQDKPEGLPQAFVIAEDFLKGDDAILILGDNLFYGQGISHIIKQSILKNKGATFLGIKVNDPERFGVINLDKNGVPIDFEEKPKKPKSNLASVGIYIFTNDVIIRSKNLKKSKRGEYEMKDLFYSYKKTNNLSLEILGRGITWLDTGTVSSLLEASNMIKLIQEKNRFIVACLEEIALKKGWISKTSLKKQIKGMSDNVYKNYLSKLLNDY